VWGVAQGGGEGREVSVRDSKLGTLSTRRGDESEVFRPELGLVGG